MALWNMWKARNLYVFQQINPNPSEILFVIKQNCVNLLSPSHNPNTIPNSVMSNSGRSPVSYWRPPSGDVVKFNSDTQFNLDFRVGFLGIVGRNHMGGLVVGATSNFFC